jgi:hypothetical protein
MRGEVLRAVIEEATALTASLPESVQGVAFAKAFDVLLEEHAVPRTKHAARTQRSSGDNLRGGALHSRPIGPKSALGQMVDNGYFDSSRDLPDIQARLRDSLGRVFGSNELSISLLRLVRDGRLSRQRNLAGQYVYWAEAHPEQVAPTQPLQRAKRARLLTDGKTTMR